MNEQDTSTSPSPSSRREMALARCGSVGGVSLVVLFSFVVLVAGCGRGDRTGRAAVDRIAHRVSEAQNGEVLDLHEIVGFEWDTLVIYDAYIWSYDEIERAEGVRLGSRWESDVPELSCFWVFRQGEERHVGFVGAADFELCEPPFYEKPADAKPLVWVWAQGDRQLRDLVWLGTEDQPGDAAGWRFLDALRVRLLAAEDGEVVDLDELLGGVPWTELSIRELAASPSAVDETWATVEGGPPARSAECLFEVLNGSATVARARWRDWDLQRQVDSRRLLHACPVAPSSWSAEEIRQIAITVAPFESSWPGSIAAGPLWPDG